MFPLATLERWKTHKSDGQEMRYQKVSGGQSWLPGCDLGLDLPYVHLCLSPGHQPVLKTETAVHTQAQRQ